MESGAFDLNVHSDARRCAALPRILLTLHSGYGCEFPAGLPISFLCVQADRNLVGDVDCNPRKDKSLAVGETMATMYQHKRISTG